MTMLFYFVRMTVFSVYLFISYFVLSSSISSKPVPGQSLTTPNVSNLKDIYMIHLEDIYMIGNM